MISSLMLYDCKEIKIVHTCQVCKVATMGLCWFSLLGLICILRVFAKFVLLQLKCILRLFDRFYCYLSVCE